MDGECLYGNEEEEVLAMVKGVWFGDFLLFWYMIGFSWVCNHSRNMKMSWIGVNVYVRIWVRLNRVAANKE